VHTHRHDDIRRWLGVSDHVRDRDAWEQAQALAKNVVDDPRSALARAVLEGGPFAMRKAEELAELVLSGDAQAMTDAGRDSTA
jgi:hypothetical protein